MAKLEVQSDVKPFTMIKNAIIDSENILNDHEKLLYIVLLRYGDKAFPSLATLSKKCGFSKSTAQRTIDTLIEKGLLKKRNRVNKKSGNTTNIYTLLDNDKIWYSTRDNLKEKIEAAILEEAIKIVESSGIKILSKEKEPEALQADQSNNDSSAQINNIDINNSTSLQPKSQEGMELYPLAILYRLYDYGTMLHDHADLSKMIDAAMAILHDALNTTNDTIRIAGQARPAEAVKSKLLKLTYMEIIYSIEIFGKQCKKIKDTRAYLLTMLYRAAEQMELDITNQYAVDRDNHSSE